MFKSLLFIFLKNPIFFVGLYFIPFLASAQINLDQGLVGYFRFENNAVDSSILGIHGVSSNVTSTSGFKNLPNTAYSFNGISSFIDYGINNRSLSNVVSLSVWVKTSSNVNVSQFILCKYNWHVDKGYFLGFKNGFPYVAGRNLSGSFSRTPNSTASISDGNWHHVLGVVNGNFWEIWVDGKLVGDLASTSASPDLTNDSPLNIGRYEEGDSQGNHFYFAGSVDEVRIYSRVLTTDEISYLSTENTITGITKIESKLDVVMYPNPTNSFLEVLSSFKIDQVEIITIQGKRIGWIDVENGMADVSFLPKGIYLVRILDTMSGNVIVRKMIKN